MSRVAEILLQIGRTRAERARETADIWGKAVANIGALPGQLQQQRREQQKADYDTALLALERAKAARAQGEYEQAQKEFARSQQLHELQSQVTQAATANDPNTWDPEAALQAAASVSHVAPHLAPDVLGWARDQNLKFRPPPVFHPAGSVGVDPLTGQPVPGAVVPEKVTYGEPKPMMIDGKRQLVRTATQGEKTWTIDLQGNKVNATIEPDQPPKSLQSENFLLNGQPVKGTFDPAAGKYFYQGQDVTGRAQPMPPASVLVGNQPLPELPAITAGTPDHKIAQDLAYGRLTFQDFNRLYPNYSRDPRIAAKKQALYMKAGELNPGFNVAQFEMGFQLAKNPKVQQQLASLDNVVQAVPDLLQISDAAARTGIPAINQLVSKAGYQIGGKSYSNFHTAQIAFADELSGALGYGSATDMSREMGLKLTDPNLSPEAFRSALTDVVVPFINRKRSTLLNQMGVYGQSGMNPAADAPTGTETAKPPKLGATRTANGETRVWTGSKWELVKKH